MPVIPADGSSVATWETAHMDTPLLGFSHVQLRVRDVAASSELVHHGARGRAVPTADDGTYVALQHRPAT